MSNAMYQKLIYLLVIIFLVVSCSKKEDLELNIPPDRDQSFEIYKEAVERMQVGDFFYASKFT